MHERACEAVMAIMKDQRCTTEVALATLKISEVELAEAFVGWRNKMHNGNKGNKMTALKEIPLSCYVCIKPNCGRKKYTSSILDPRFCCVCGNGKLHRQWKLLIE